MSRRNYQIGLFLALTLILSGCASPNAAGPGGKKDGLPAWAKNGKHSQYPQGVFWTGLGSGADMTSATDKARAEVSAQLQVRIKSVATSTESEFMGSDGDYYRSAFESQVESLVDESIQGIVIAEMQQIGSEYYAFAVLNKSTFLGALHAELQGYTDKLTRLYKDAESMLDRGEIFPAIENLSEAMELVPEVYPREKFYNALSEINFALPSDLQGAALLSYVRAVLSNIELTLVKGGNQTAPPGQRLAKPVIVRVTLLRSGRKIPIAKIPLRASYLAGDRAGKVNTDDDGFASFVVSAVPGERPTEGSVRIALNLGRLPEIMGPELRNLEQVVNYTIAGEVAGFAVIIKSSTGKRLSKVEASVEEIVMKAGFRIDPQSKMLIKGVVSDPVIRKIELGGSPTFQAEANLRLEVFDITTDTNRASMEVSKKTVNKDRGLASTQAVQKVGTAVKRKALAEMLADALVP